MPRKHVCHSNYPFPNTQNISTHGHTEIRLITFFVAKDEEALYSLQKKKQQQQKRTGAGCGLDHELFIAKFRFKLKKVGKITRSFTYDLNQISYDYTVDVTIRFKG